MQAVVWPPPWLSQPAESKTQFPVPTVEPSDEPEPDRRADSHEVLVLADSPERTADSDVQAPASAPPPAIEIPAELEALLGQVEADAMRLTSDPKLLQAARNLLADCRDMWREGKTETALFLARDYRRRFPAYLAERTHSRRSRA